MTYPLSDSQARIYVEAVSSLGRIAQALPLEAVDRWLQLEHRAILRGDASATGADSRWITQILLITNSAREIESRMTALDQLVWELEQERAAAAEAAEHIPQRLAECGQPWPCEHAPDGGNHPKAAQPYGDRRDEPVPDDWAP